MTRPWLLVFDHSALTSGAHVEGVEVLLGLDRTEYQERSLFAHRVMVSGRASRSGPEVLKPFSFCAGMTLLI